MDSVINCTETAPESIVVEDIGLRMESQVDSFSNGLETGTIDSLSSCNVVASKSSPKGSGVVMDAVSSPVSSNGGETGTTDSPSNRFSFVVATTIASESFDCGVMSPMDAREIVLASDA
jgi:hypothetical protein